MEGVPSAKSDLSLGTTKLDALYDALDFPCALTRADLPTYLRRLRATPPAPAPAEELPWFGYVLAAVSTTSNFVQMIYELTSSRRMIADF